MLCDNPNFELCSSVYKKIASKSSSEDWFSELNDTELTIIYVWYISGVIENGGFEYLFSSRLPGDPYYLTTIKSFKKIKCQVAADIIKEAISLFPYGKISTDDETRKEIFANLPLETRDALASSFFQELAGITGKLANFIRKNSEIIKK